MSLEARPGGLLALSEFLIQEEERMAFAQADAVDGIAHRFGSDLP